VHDGDTVEAFVGPHPRQEHRIYSEAIALC